MAVYGGVMGGHILLLLGPLLVSGCADGLCGNQVLRTAVSPDGQHVAVVFERDCGATTGDSFQVSILSPGEAPNGAGNIFISAPGRSASEDSQVQPVELIWLAPDRLRIQQRARDEVFRRVREWDGVRIEYRAGDAGG